MLFVVQKKVMKSGEWLEDKQDSVGQHLINTKIIRNN